MLQKLAVVLSPAASYLHLFASFSYLGWLGQLSITDSESPKPNHNTEGPGFMWPLTQEHLRAINQNNQDGCRCSKRASMLLTNLMNKIG